MFISIIEANQLTNEQGRNRTCQYIEIYALMHLMMIVLIDAIMTLKSAMQLCLAQLFITINVLCSDSFQS